MWQKYRDYLIQILISLAISIILIGLLLPVGERYHTIINRLDFLVYDLEMQLQTPQKTNKDTPDVFLIDIDEKSMEMASGGAWRDGIVADIINAIANYQPQLIVLDVHFAQRPIHPISRIENLYTQELGKDFPIELPDQVYEALDDSILLTEAIQTHKVITSFAFHDETTDINFLPIGIPQDYNLIAKRVYFRGYSSGYHNPSADYQGFSNEVADPDGVVRSAPLYLPFATENKLYPSVALVAARRFFNEPLINDLLEQGTLHTALQNNYDQIPQLARHNGHYIYKGVRLNRTMIPTDQYGQILIPYRQQQGQIKRISAHNFFKKDANRPLPKLKDSVVFIGSSSKRLGDTFATPIHKQVSNMELQAHTFLGLLNPSQLTYEPYWHKLALVAQSIGLAFIMLLLYPIMRPHMVLLVGTVLIITSIATHLAFLQFASAYVSPVTPLLLILSITLLFLFSHLFRDSQHRSHLQTVFGQYVPPEHIEYMMQQKNHLDFVDERREMSVMFADLHQFTELVESFQPQQLKEFLSDYLTPATDIIFEYHGTIDKYIGDLIMAFWGAPMEDKNHARHSVLAALALQDMLKSQNNVFTRYYGSEKNIRLGIGINTGTMNVGDMGSKHRRSFTVMGDAVNLASRVESLTRYYQVDILVTTNTMQQCHDIAFRLIDRVRVKGKTQHVRLYQPLGKAENLAAIQKDQLKVYELALKHYWRQDWDTAANLFAKLLVISPADPIYSLYMQRIHHFIENPPAENWDGIHTHLHK